MTRDEITRIAQEDGIVVTGEAVWRLCELVAAAERQRIYDVLMEQHERDKVARWMMERGYATGHGDTVEDMLDELDWQVRERERQRIEDLLMEQHESAKGRHNYWQVAAEWVRVGTDEEI
jgi:hypothetical protein